MLKNIFKSNFTVCVNLDRKTEKKKTWGSLVRTDKFFGALLDHMSFLILFVCFVLFHTKQNSENNKNI